MKLYTFFNFTSTAATEMRPLSHKTPQSFHRPSYCGVQTFPLKMHYGGEKLGENWRSGRILTPNERVLTFGVRSGLWCKVSSKLSEICHHRRGNRQTEGHTDASDFIICPMLCYSNGTNKKVMNDNLELIILLVTNWTLKNSVFVIKFDHSRCMHVLIKNHSGSKLITTI